MDLVPDLDQIEPICVVSVHKHQVEFTSHVSIYCDGLSVGTRLNVYLELASQVTSKRLQQAKSSALAILKVSIVPHQGRLRHVQLVEETLMVKHGLPNADLKPWLHEITKVNGCIPKLSVEVHFD